MSEKNKEQTKEEKKTTRELPVVVVPIYKEDAKALGYDEVADGKARSELRSKIRETLNLPVRVRTSGVQAQIKEKLGLSADATPSEVNKAMRQKMLEL